jgi:hypothetical protein
MIEKSLNQYRYDYYDDFFGNFSRNENKIKKVLDFLIILVMSSCVTGYLFIVTLREYKIFPVAGKTYSNKQSPKSMAWIVTQSALHH